MNRILVTGLALGTDPNIDACQSCNYDLSWLFGNPSTLLWADQIVLTPEILEMIKNSSYPDGNKDIGRAVGLIFERIEENGLIKTKKASSIITNKVRDEIFTQINEDRNRLAKIFPRSVKLGDEEKVPGQLFVNGVEYCTPSLWTMYASFILAREWKADLLLPPQSQNYFDRALVSLQNPQQDGVEKHTAFEEILKSKLPEQELLPIILFDAKLCGSCGNKSSCSSDVFAKVETNIKNIMMWRSYDEVQELKSVISRIAKEADNTGVSSKELVAAFKEEEDKINKSIRSVFPKVERWSNMATVLSIPVVVAGLSTGSTAIASVGAGVAGVATVAKKYIDIVRSKYRWVGHKIGK